MYTAWSVQDIDFQIIQFLKSNFGYQIGILKGVKNYEKDNLKMLYTSLSLFHCINYPPPLLNLIHVHLNVWYMVLTNLWKNCWTWSEVVRSLTLGSTGGRIWLSLPGLLVMGKAPWPPGRLLFKVVAVEVALTWLLNDVFAYVWNSRIKTSVTQIWRASTQTSFKMQLFFF